MKLIIFYSRDVKMKNKLILIVRLFYEFLDWQCYSLNWIIIVEIPFYFLLQRILYSFISIKSGSRVVMLRLRDWSGYYYNSGELFFSVFEIQRRLFPSSDLFVVRIYISSLV